MTPEEMKEFVENFSLDHCSRGNQGYDRVLIQLFGYLGHGKSSFINSCKYVLEGEFRLDADQRDDFTGTMARKSYQLTNAITMVDNRGMKRADCHETGLIYAQLGNLMPLDQHIEWPKDYTEIMTWIESGDMDPNYTDFIVPVFVSSVKTILVEHEIPELRSILENAETLTGIKPFVVLTHKSGGKLMEIRNVFLNMGINYIFQVENYTVEKHKKVRATHDEFLKFLFEVLKDVECRMEEPRNPMQDRVSRKSFILKFAHEKELEEKMRALAFTIKSHNEVLMDDECHMRKEMNRMREEACEKANRKLPCVVQKGDECYMRKEMGKEINWAREETQEEANRKLSCVVLKGDECHMRKEMGKEINWVREETCEEANRKLPCVVQKGDECYMRKEMGKEINWAREETQEEANRKLSCVVLKGDECHMRKEMGKEINWVREETCEEANRKLPCVVLKGEECHMGKEMKRVREEAQKDASRENQGSCQLN